MVGRRVSFPFGWNGLFSGAFAVSFREGSIFLPPQFFTGKKYHLYTTYSPCLRLGVIDGQIRCIQKLLRINPTSKSSRCTLVKVQLEKPGWFDWCDCLAKDWAISSLSKPVDVQHFSTSTPTIDLIFKIQPLVNSGIYVSWSDFLGQTFNWDRNALAEFSREATMRNINLFYQSGH